jgi:hypothetical protein
MSEDEVLKLRRELELVASQRDELLAKLTELERTVAEETRAALAALSEEQQRAAQLWTAERDELRARIAVLEEQPDPTARPGIGTDELAEHFRGVLESLAAPAPAEGRPFAAALTGLEVEARGLLVTPAEGEGVRLAPIDPAQVPEGSELGLSTVRLRFGLLPKIVPDGTSET